MKLRSPDDSVAALRHGPPGRLGWAHKSEDHYKGDFAVEAIVRAGLPLLINHFGC